MDTTVKKDSPGLSVDTWALARYCVAVVEGSIMLARGPARNDETTHQPAQRPSEAGVAGWELGGSWKSL